MAWRPLGRETGARFSLITTLKTEQMSIWKIDGEPWKNWTWSKFLLRLQTLFCLPFHSKLFSVIKKNNFDIFVDKG